MLYNLSNKTDAESFLARALDLIRKESIEVELTNKEPRSLNQNRYMHALFGAVGMELGESAEYVKEQYYKRIVNPEIFVYRKIDRITGKEEIRTRSSAKVGKEDTSTAITRFIKWAADMKIRLPQP